MVEREETEKVSQLAIPFCSGLDDVPRIFAGVAKFAASHTGTETVVTDTDGFVLERVGKVVFPFGHGADEDTDALRRTEGVDVISDPDDVGVETEGNLATVRGEVVGDGVFDDLEQLLLRVDRADGKSVQELDHETREPPERSRNTHGRAHFDEHAFCRVDVNLQSAGFVDRRVEEREETLCAKKEVEVSTPPPSRFLGRC